MMMMTPYSFLKKIIPTFVRNFIRDLDSAYHNLERKIDEQKKLIQELENSYDDLLNAHQNLQDSYQKLQKSNQELENSYGDLLNVHQNLQDSYQKLQESKELLQNTNTDNFNSIIERAKMSQRAKEIFAYKYNLDQEVQPFINWLTSSLQNA